MRFINNVIVYLVSIWMILSIGMACATAQSILNADDLRQAGQLLQAIEAYKLAINDTSSSARNTYDLACAYALTAQKDSAFHYLTIALERDSSLWVLTDADLYALIDDPRWDVLADSQLTRFQLSTKPIEAPEYAKALLQIILKDQALDYHVDQAKAFYVKEGSIPHWYYPLGNIKARIVRENYEVLSALIASHGWPTYTMVGELAADAPLLVINHHEDESVRKQFLPVIKQACLNNEGSCVEFAKIQDRILVDNNEPQLYGMQFHYNSERQLVPFPIADPALVDERRAAIGLEPLADYLKRKINYIWSPE